MPEFKVEFLITGTKISADEITKLIGVSPTRSWDMGDFIPKTNLRRKHNGWCLSYDDSEKIKDIDEAMLFLLNILLPKSKQIIQISKEYDLECEMNTVIYISDQVPAINLSKEIVCGLAELRAMIDIDIILLN